MPANFRDLFILHGWDGIKEVVRAHRRSIQRWIVECGEDELKAARQAYLEERYAARNRRVPGIKPGRTRAARYVLGQRLGERTNRG